MPTMHVTAAKSLDHTLTDNSVKVIIPAGSPGVVTAITSIPDNPNAPQHGMPGNVSSTPGLSITWTNVLKLVVATGTFTTPASYVDPIPTKPEEVVFASVS